jgi:hypothetical protein
MGPDRPDQYREAMHGVLATRWHDGWARASGGIGCDGPGMETAGTVSWGRDSRIQPQPNLNSTS